ATCHWTVGAGAPSAAAINEVPSPAAATTPMSGCRVTVGGTTVSAFADVATSLTPPTTTTATRTDTHAPPRRFQAKPDFEAGMLLMRASLILRDVDSAITSTAVAAKTFISPPTFLRVGRLTGRPKDR